MIDVDKLDMHLPRVNENIRGRYSHDDTGTRQGRRAPSPHRERVTLVTEAGTTIA